MSLRTPPAGPGEVDPGPPKSEAWYDQGEQVFRRFYLPNGLVSHDIESNPRTGVDTITEYNDHGDVTSDDHD